MIIKIIPVGNSSGVIFPKDFLHIHNLHRGDLIDVEEKNKLITLKIIKKKQVKKWTLAELIKGAKPVKLTDEDNAWINMK